MKEKREEEEFNLENNNNVYNNVCVCVPLCVRHVCVVNYVINVHI